MRRPAAMPGSRIGEVVADRFEGGDGGRAAPGDRKATGPRNRGQLAVCEGGRALPLQAGDRDHPLAREAVEPHPHATPEIMHGGEVDDLALHPGQGPDAFEVDGTVRQQGDAVAHGQGRSRRKRSRLRLHGVLLLLDGQVSIPLRM